MSYWLSGAGRMPSRCAATLPPFWEKTSLCSASFFRGRYGDGVEDELFAVYTCLGSLESKDSLGELSQ